MNKYLKLSAIALMSTTLLAGCGSNEKKVKSISYTVNMYDIEKQEGISDKELKHIEESYGFKLKNIKMV